MEATNPMREAPLAAPQVLADNFLPQEHNHLL
jgi:hypothetical protein